MGFYQLLLTPKMVINTYKYCLQVQVHVFVNVLKYKYKYLLDLHVQSTAKYS